MQERRSLHFLNGLTPVLRKFDIECANRSIEIINHACTSPAAMHAVSGMFLQYAKRSLLLFLTLAFLRSLLGVTAALADGLRVEEIAPGVFVHQGADEPITLGNRGNIANIGFIIGKRAVAVIDPGGTPEEGRALLEAIQIRTSLPVTHVILTHMHPDHVFGAAAFVRPDVAFVGHRRLNAGLEARFDYYVASHRREAGEDLAGKALDVRVTLPVSDETEIDLGDRVLELRAWPVAHTDNDLTIFDRTTGVLFAGDLVFTHHLPTIDGSLLGWQKVLVDLTALPASRVVPGHGAVGQPWPQAAEPERRYFDRLAADIRAALKAGRSLADTVATAGDSEAGNWVLFDNYNKRNATAAYAELEWE